MQHPTRAVMRRTGLWLLVVALLVPVAACRRMTEQEALEAAREEIRGEIQPEIDRKQKEIEALKREIATVKSRMAARDGDRD